MSDWLKCTQDDVDAINALLPSKTRVEAYVDVNGDRFLGADLQGDCGPGGTYQAAASIIMGLEPGDPVFPPPPDPNLPPP